MKIRSELAASNSPRQKRIASLLRNLIFGEGGGSLVEVAILMGFLAAPMVFGTCEVASLAYASIEISNAAHAGAAFAAQNYNAKTVLPTAAQVTAAAQSDVPDAAAYLKPGTSLTAIMATGCTGGAATVGNTLPTNCAGAQPYVQVTVTATVVPPIQLPGLFGSQPAQMTMNTSATIPLVN